VSGGRINMLGRLKIHSTSYSGQYLNLWWHLRFPEEVTEGAIEIVNAAGNVYALIPDLPLNVWPKKASGESIYFSQLTGDAKNKVHGLILLEEPLDADSASKMRDRSGFVCRRIGMTYLFQGLQMDIYPERIVTEV
jgi:hypothetical protein